MNARFFLRTRLILTGIGSAFGCISVSISGATEAAMQRNIARTIWVDDAHADFARGRLSASGRNLYISQTGSIQQVFHYDLNQDGSADLLFNSAHDFILAPPVTLVDLTGNEVGRSRPLPGIGARMLKTGDFDADGRTDLLTVEESQWVNTRNYLHVYWGQESGEWNQTRLTDLLGEAAKDVEVLDWDGDGRSDIVVLMNAGGENPGGTSRRTLRVYWGGENGFLQSDSTDLAAPGIDEIESFSDAGPLLALTEKGAALERISVKERGELVATNYRLPGRKIGNLRVHRHGADVLILASSEPGGTSQIDPTTARSSAIWSRLVRLELRDNEVVEAVPSPPLAHSSYFWSEQRADLLFVADVSKGANSAQVITDFDQKTMMFGASRELSAPGYVSGVALAGEDDSPVVVLTSFRDEDNYDTRSWVLRLDDALHGRESVARPQTLQTQGATGLVEIKPSRADQWRGSRLAFLNRISGSYVELVPAMIYWGSKQGFAPERRLDIPFYSGIVGASSDLNDDDRPDLVLVSQVHNVHAPKPYMGLHVYAGTVEHAFSETSILEEYGVRGLAVADLDRDGWLDLVGSVLNGPSERRGWVLWRGGEGGFSRDRRSFIPFPLAHGLPAIADVDRDGWLDVAMPSMRGNEIRIYRSLDGRFDAERFDSIPAWQANQLDFADMNSDGHVDLISASGLGPGTFFRDYGIQIFWGGSDGYDPRRAQRLPAHGAVGFLIQDWDRDGHLDIFAPNYHTGITREGTSARIYWGSASGLNSNRYTYLPVNAAAGAFAMDFDGNGTLDIAISSHTTDGSHHTQSPIYYNRDGRFGEPQERVLLPTVGPQQMYSSGAGDQYGRKLHEWFESAPIPLEGCRSVRISAISKIPSTASLQFSFRTAASSSELANAIWQQASLEEWHATPEGSRVLQYRADFHAAWGDAEYAEVDRVDIQGE